MVGYRAQAVVVVNSLVGDVDDVRVAQESVYVAQVPKVGMVRVKCHQRVALVRRFSGLLLWIQFSSCALLR